MHGGIGAALRTDAPDSRNRPGAHFTRKGFEQKDQGEIDCEVYQPTRRRRAPPLAGPQQKECKMKAKVKTTRIGRRWSAALITDVRHVAALGDTEREALRKLSKSAEIWGNDRQAVLDVVQHPLLAGES